MAGAPAGWYDDPEDASRLRKWDGTGWTDSWMARGSGAARAQQASARAPLPGWHRDPADAARHRWWDGRAWTPRVVDGPLFLEKERRGGGFRTLGYALLALFALHVVSAVALIGANIWAWGVFGRWVDDPSSILAGDSELLESAGLLLQVGSALASLVTAVLFVAWLHSAYGSDRVDPGALRFSRGWTVGVWFVPFLNLVRPHGLVRDLWRGLGDRIPRSPGPWVITVWWVTLVLARTVASATRVAEVAVAAEMGTSEETVLAGIERLRPLLWWENVAALGWGVAAVLGAVVVLRVDRAMHAGEHDAPLPAAPPAA